MPAELPECESCGFNAAESSKGGVYWASDINEDAVYVAQFGGKSAGAAVVKKDVFSGETLDLSFPIKEGESLDGFDVDPKGRYFTAAISTVEESVVWILDTDLSRESVKSKRIPGMRFTLPVTQLQVNRSGNFILVCAEDKVLIWHFKKDTMVHDFAFDQPVVSCKVCPIGECLTVALADGTFVCHKLKNFSEGEEEKVPIFVASNTFSKHDGVNPLVMDWSNAVSSAVSYNGIYLLLPGAKPSVRIRDVVDDRPVSKTIEKEFVAFDTGVDGEILSVQWLSAETNPMIVAISIGGTDAQVQIWSFDPEKEGGAPTMLNSFKTPSPIISMKWRPKSDTEDGRPINQLALCRADLKHCVLKKPEEKVAAPAVASVADDLGGIFQEESDEEMPAATAADRKNKLKAKNFTIDEADEADAEAEADIPEKDVDMEMDADKTESPAKEGEEEKNDDVEITDETFAEEDIPEEFYDEPASATPAPRQQKTKYVTKPNQRPFQPFETFHDRGQEDKPRFLAQCATGAVTTRKHAVESQGVTTNKNIVEYTYVQNGRNKSTFFEEECNFHIAAMNEKAIVLASKRDGEMPGQIHVRMMDFELQKVVPGWTHALGSSRTNPNIDNEDVVNVAIGDKFVAATTSLNQLRVFSYWGLQFGISCFDGDAVALTARGHQIFLTYSRNGEMKYLIFRCSPELGLQQQGDERGLILSKPTNPEKEVATLRWLGISNEAMPITIDLKGVVRGLFPDNSWKPMLNLNHHRPNDEHHWPIDVDGPQLMCYTTQGPEIPPNANDRSLKPIKIKFEIPFFPWHGTKRPHAARAHLYKLTSWQLEQASSQNLLTGIVQNTAETEAHARAVQSDVELMRLFIKACTDNQEEALDVSKFLNFGANMELAIQKAQELNRRALAKKLKADLELMEAEELMNAHGGPGLAGAGAGTGAPSQSQEEVMSDVVTAARNNPPMDTFQPLDMDMDTDMTRSKLQQEPKVNMLDQCFGAGASTAVQQPLSPGAAARVQLRGKKALGGKWELEINGEAERFALTDKMDTGAYCTNDVLDLGPGVQKVPSGHQTRVNNIAVNKETLLTQGLPFTVQFCRSTAAVASEQKKRFQADYKVQTGGTVLDSLAEVAVRGQESGQSINIGGKRAANMESVQQSFKCARLN